MSVDHKLPCQLIYSLCHHNYLGYLIEPHIVQLNPNGELSMSYQRIFSHTAKPFYKYLSDADIKLIKQLDETEQNFLIKKYYKQAIRPYEFFEKHFDEKFFTLVRSKLDKKIAETLVELQQHDRLYLMGKDGWPAAEKLSIANEPTSVLFHFRRNETETRYFPTLKYQGSRIDFMFKNAQIICNKPAWMLIGDTLHYFDAEVEGKKLTPFLNKRYIAIPKATEETYFQKFVAPLIEKHHVYAEGFDIKTLKENPTPILKIIFVQNGASQAQLYFRYGNYTFSMTDAAKITVRIEKEGDNYTFVRVKRQHNFEQEKFNQLINAGLHRPSLLLHHLELPFADKQPLNASYGIFAWLNTHAQLLQTEGFEVDQSSLSKRFVLGDSRIDFEVSEQNDWFDINATVYFGEYAVPFLSLKQHILNNRPEYQLPDGSVAIIPETWFTQFGALFKIANSGDKLQVRKYHIGLIQDLAEDGIAQISMDRKLQRLTDFEQISDYPLPKNFKGQLRHYQKAGYNWFNFLREYRFGGCLADDMGLGKTIQTLALLQKRKEELNDKGETAVSLIVMPTSLIYNWLSEAKKFCPTLRFIAHTGINRNKDLSELAAYDVVITTYGILRIDVELFEHYYFDYVILDESQNIKNASSKSFKAVRALKSTNRLVLSGTPVENTVADLWPQLTFLNPGLLGSHASFNDEFVQGIEKRKEEDKAKKLQALIKPFVLRRTKEQVAAELPPKTEKVFYCNLSEDQAAFYDKTKSAYRNDILVGIEKEGLAQKNIQILQGLTALRQIANHPKMVDESYQSDSGKLDDVLYTLDNVLDGGHKVLIFSQFVKHLDIIRTNLDKKKIGYAYLDGSTRDRGDVVANFQQDPQLKVFLISLKAGGVGLNLTQADYVFILDPWWNPASEQQAIDRTHRIGQTKNVFIYKFISKDTVEEKILALQQRKKKLASSLITTEESFFKSLSKADITDLLS
jgi:superfamily II DNA or RNA helicase